LYVVVAVKEEGIDIWKKVNEDMRRSEKMIKSEKIRC